MANAAFPSVIAAVMTVAADALPFVSVVRGRDVSQESGDVVMVGVRDMLGDQWEAAGAFQQTMQTFGGNREEVGSVSCLVVAWNGNGDQDAASTAAFDHLAAIEAAVRADQTLGLTAFDYVVAEFEAGDVSESQNPQGAAVALSFSITYKIRI